MNLIEKIIADFISKQGTAEEISPEELLLHHPQHKKELIKSLEALSAIDETLNSFNSKQPRLPEKLGRYELVKAIGMGGMGTVMLAFDPQLKRQVAVKVLRNLSFGNTQSIERFYRESLSIAALSHPNIVPIYEVDEDKGFHFLVMQYLDGIGLDSFITWASRHSAELDQNIKNRRFPKIDSQLDANSPLQADSYLEMVCKLGVQAGNAVAFAHEKNILHRDLKPANMMLTRQGRLVIFDFGLSQDLNETRLTVSGQILGTPFYAPPEQLLPASKQELTPKVDIYSLGVSLYEMLTFNLPYPDGSLAKLIAAYKQEKDISIRKRLPHLHTDLITIIDKAIELKPSNRYDSMKDFVEDLEHFICHEPIKARPPTLLRRSLRRTHSLLKSPKIWASCFLVGFVILLGLTQQFQRKTQQHESLQLYNEALFAKVDADNTEAQELFLRASKLDPYNPKIWAALHDGANDLQQRRDFIDKGLAFNPKSKELLSIKGGLIAQLEGPQKASSFIDKLLKDYPNDEAFLFAKGLNMGNTKSIEAAKQFAQQGLNKNPDSERMNYLMGLLCEQEKNNICAHKYYARAIDLPPYRSSKAITIINYFRNHQKKFAAQVLANKALNKDYSNSLLHYLAFQIAMETFDVERAKHHAESLIQLSPDVHKGWIAKAEVASSNLKHQSALGYLSHSYKQNKKPDLSLIEHMIYEYAYLEDGKAILELSHKHQSLLGGYYPLTSALGHYIKRAYEKAWNSLQSITPKQFENYSLRMQAYRAHLKALVLSKQNESPISLELKQAISEHQENLYVKRYLLRRYWQSLDNSEKTEQNALAFLQNNAIATSLRKRELLFPPDWRFEVDNNLPTYFYISPFASPLDGYRSSCKILLKLSHSSAEQKLYFDQLFQKKEISVSGNANLAFESGLELLQDKDKKPYGYKISLFSKEADASITAFCSAPHFKEDSTLLKAFIKHYVESQPSIHFSKDS